jgi:hypothetical protein
VLLSSEGNHGLGEPKHSFIDKVPRSSKISECSGIKLEQTLRRHIHSINNASQENYSTESGKLALLHLDDTETSTSANEHEAGAGLISRGWAPDEWHDFGDDRQLIRGMELWYEKY